VTKQPLEYAHFIIIYLRGWSGTKSTITEATYWHLLALEDRLLQWSNQWNELWAGETEVLGENLPQFRFVLHKFHLN
jgi:hypothetical protein